MKPAMLSSPATPSQQLTTNNVLFYHAAKYNGKKEKLTVILPISLATKAHKPVTSSLVPKQV